MKNYPVNCGDYTKAWNKAPCLNGQDSMKSKAGFFSCSFLTCLSGQCSHVSIWQNFRCQLWTFYRSLFSSWWLNEPTHLKNIICASQIGSFPRNVLKKIPQIFELPRDPGVSLLICKPQSKDLCFESSTQNAPKTGWRRLQAKQTGLCLLCLLNLIENSKQSYPPWN